MCTTVIGVMPIDIVSYRMGLESALEFIRNKSYDSLKAEGTWLHPVLEAPFFLNWVRHNRRNQPWHLWHLLFLRFLNCGFSQGGLSHRPPKFEHIFVVVITFSPFLLCANNYYTSLLLIVCALRWYVKSLYRHFFLEDIAIHARVTQKMAPPNFPGF